MDELLTVDPPLPMQQLDQRLRKIPTEHRLAALVVGLERVSPPAERIAVLKPLITGHREVAAAHPYVVYALAEAQAAAGLPADATVSLAMLEHSDQALEQADRLAATAALALANRNHEDAQRWLTLAGQQLAAAVPDVGYATWRSRFIAFRLSRLTQRIEEARALEIGSPAYWAWLQADRMPSIATYEAVAEQHPKTLFGAASRLSAARLHLANGDAAACLRLLSAVDDQSLEPETLILRGDALVMVGKQLPAAKAAYEAALSALNAVSEIPDLSAPLLHALTPGLAPHRLDSSSYPVWADRQLGTLLIPQFAPEIAAYWRYQAVVRVVALTALAGDAPAAAVLARTLCTFDNIDRQMEIDQCGAGGRVLAAIFEGKEFVIPLAGFKASSPDVLARIMLAVACYQVYDWSQSEWWASQALATMRSSASQSRDGVIALIACNAQMLRNYEQALSLARSITMRRGQPANWAWFRAHQVIMEILQHGNDHVSVMANLQDVVDQAPGTSFARDAQFLQATYAINLDAKLQRRLLLAFRAAHPEDPRQPSVTEMLNDLDVPRTKPESP